MQAAPFGAGAECYARKRIGIRIVEHLIERIDGRRFGTVLLGPTHTGVDRLLLLLEQILEDELAPSAAACVHQRATLVELAQLDGGESELFGQGRYGCGRVLVVARQKDDAVPTLDDRIGSQGGCNQVIETFHDLSATSDKVFGCELCSVV